MKLFEVVENIESILKKYKIANYKITPKGVDVDGDVDLSVYQLKSIPIKFGVVTGNFDCSANNLTSLEGAPREVGGNFYCHSNAVKFEIKHVPKTTKIFGKFEA